MQRRKFIYLYNYPLNINRIFFNNPVNHRGTLCTVLQLAFIFYLFHSRFSLFYLGNVWNEFKGTPTCAPQSSASKVGKYGRLKWHFEECEAFTKKVVWWTPVRTLSVFLILPQQPTRCTVVSRVICCIQGFLTVTHWSIVTGASMHNLSRVLVSSRQLSLQPVWSTVGWRPWMDKILPLEEMFVRNNKHLLAIYAVLRTPRLPTEYLWYFTVLNWFTKELLLHFPRKNVNAFLQTVFHDTY